VGNVVGSEIGSFRVLTTEDWRRASFGERLWYRVGRHPLTILCAYLTVFFISICLVPLLVAPRKHWDSALSLLAHGGLLILLTLWGGVSTAVFAMALPMAIAAALGGYLFYAQHNFEGARSLEPDDWNYFRGALESSSFLKLGPLMNWITANIGYHHVHHVNPQIPFYRLPEAMAAIPELQEPLVTTLRLRDVWASLQQNLWDPERQRMVSYREATAPPAGL
jgi:omega-6 fatty acid desaturase (delta-12 desaturase)